MLHFLYVGHFVHEGDFIRFDRQPDGGLRPAVERPLSMTAVQKLFRQKGLNAVSIPKEWGIWSDDGFLVCDAVTRSRDAIDFIRDLAKETGCDLADYSSQLLWSPDELTAARSFPEATNRKERFARIEWLSPAQGGRNLPPAGPRYSTPVRFETQAVGAESATWSLVVEMIDRAADSMAWTARVHFLFEDAPSELLVDGASFELFEGSKRVAKGVVLPSTLGTNAANQPAAVPQLN